MGTSRYPSNRLLVSPRFFLVSDLVLSGHAHVYERLMVDNIPYIVNGVGGHSIYAFDDVSSPYSQVCFNGDFGALLIDASADKLALQFVTRGNQNVDTYTLFAP